MSPIKTWLKSYLRYGFGLIPATEDYWLETPVNKKVGVLVCPTSRLLPFGKMRLIPYELEKTFFRKMGKSKTAINVFKSLSTMVAIAPLVADMADYNSADLLSLYVFLIIFMIGIIIPVFIYAFRTAKFLKSQMPRVYMNKNFRKKANLFNFAFYLFYFLLGFISGLIDALLTNTSSQQKLTTQAVSDVTSDTLGEFFQTSVDVFSAIVITFFKSLLGLALMVILTLIMLQVSVWFDETGGQVLTLSIILIGGGLLWSYLYFFKSERKKS